MKTIYERPKIFTDAITTYCGGCGHGIVNKIIAELIDEVVDFRPDCYNSEIISGKATAIVGRFGRAYVGKSE